MASCLPIKAYDGAQHVNSAEKNAHNHHHQSDYGKK